MVTIKTVRTKIPGQYIMDTGMIRFYQQKEMGCGGYTKNKEKLFGDPSLEQLVADIQSSGLNKKTLPV